MAIKARAPVLGGNFGVWGGLFSTYDCAVKSIRQKEDPWKYVSLAYFPRESIWDNANLFSSAIIAGFFTGGSLAVRGIFQLPLSLDLSVYLLSSCLLHFH